MIPLISTASLIGIVLAFQVFGRIRAEVAPLTAVCTVVMALYVASFAGWLAPAATLLYAAGVLLGALATARVLTAAPANRLAIVIAVSAFAALAAISWVCLHGAAYSTWDEFSHWGRIAKSLSVTHALPTASTGVALKDYPPGAALLHYFVVGSRFSEGATYYAQALLLIAAVLALLRWTTAADTLHYMLGLALGLLVMGVLGLGYETVEVDHVLGAMFGAALGAYAVGDRSDHHSTLALVPVIFCLPLMKPVGIVLALGAAAVIAFDTVRTFVAAEQPGRHGDMRRRYAATAAICIMVFGAPLAAQQSWKARVVALQFKTTFKVGLTREGVRALLDPAARTRRQQAVVSSFAQAMSQASIGRDGNGIIHAGRWIGRASPLPPRSGWRWLLCLTGLSVLALYLVPREARATHAVVHAALPVGCLAYLALLLYVYLFGFGEYEGARVISFGRYASTWFLGWALAIVAALGLGARGNRWQYTASLMILVSSVAWGAAQHMWRGADPDERETAEERSKVRAVTRLLDGRIDPAARVYVIWQGSAGLAFQLTAYELSPRRTNPFCWSLGEKHFEGDIWTCPWPPEQFAQRLRDYDYLVVGGADERFWKTYEALFDGRANEANKSAVLFETIPGSTLPVLRRVPLVNRP